MFVSVVIPCLNEEKFIAKCLDSIIANDYPKDKLEVMVVDGMSEDETRKILGKYTQQYPFIRRLDNPKKIIPTAMNIGIKESQGEIVCIIGAHAEVEKDFISKNVRSIEKYDADCVGGTSVVLPSDNTLVARSISIALASPFGRGNAYYMSKPKKPMLVDTVGRPCYKKEVFKKIGLLNEKLLRNHDFEFNLRLKKAGGKILLVPDIVGYYYPKSNFKDFFTHNIADGFSITHPLKFGVKAFSWRHLLSLVFILALLGAGILGIFFPFFFWLFLIIIGAYLLANVYFSCRIMVREKDFRYLFLMPTAFACRHIGYGLGSLWGIIKVCYPQRIKSEEKRMSG